MADSHVRNHSVKRLHSQCFLPSLQELLICRDLRSSPESCLAHNTLPAGWSTCTAHSVPGPPAPRSHPPPTHSCPAEGQGLQVHLNTSSDREPLSMARFTRVVELFVHIHFLKINRRRDGIESLQNMVFGGQYLLLGGYWWYWGHRVHKYSIQATDLKENGFWGGKSGYTHTLPK